jgi:hypothetical protein
MSSDTRGFFYDEIIYFTDAEVEIEALYKAEEEGRVD